MMSKKIGKTLMLTLICALGMSSAANNSADKVAFPNFDGIALVDFRPPEAFSEAVADVPALAPDVRRSSITVIVGKPAAHKIAEESSAALIQPISLAQPFRHSKDTVGNVFTYLKNLIVVALRYAGGATRSRIDTMRRQTSRLYNGTITIAQEHPYLTAAAAVVVMYGIYYGYKKYDKKLKQLKEHEKKSSYTSDSKRYFESMYLNSSDGLFTLTEQRTEGYIS